MRKFWFKLFGDFKIFFWIQGLLIALYLSLSVLTVWIIYHFISKYW